jgi:hypothetical protein
MTVTFMEGHVSRPLCSVQLLTAFRLLHPSADIQYRLLNFCRGIVVTACVSFSRYSVYNELQHTPVPTATVTADCRGVHLFMLFKVQ